MYRILAHSEITLDQHDAMSIRFAANRHLFVVTGIGATLITDCKENLHEIFEPGKEVISYQTLEEFVELAKYYLEHDEEREAISHVG